MIVDQPISVSLRVYLIFPIFLESYKLTQFKMITAGLWVMGINHLPLWFVLIFPKFGELQITRKIVI